MPFHKGGSWSEQAKRSKAQYKTSFPPVTAFPQITLLRINSKRRAICFLSGKHTVIAPVLPPSPLQSWRLDKRRPAAGKRGLTLPWSLPSHSVPDPPHCFSLPTFCVGSLHNIDKAVRNSVWNTDFSSTAESLILNLEIFCLRFYFLVVCLKSQLLPQTSCKRYTFTPQLVVVPYNVFFQLNLLPAYT